MRKVASMQPHASGSAPQPSHLLPPANVPIYRDLHDTDSQHRYDPSTNPYSQGMSAMPTPSPWHIPSYPQVHIPPPLYQHNQLLPVNRQFYENFSSSFAGNLELGDNMPPLPPFPPLPLNHGLALNIPYPSSDPMHDPVNLEAPLFMCPPDMNNPVSQMPDNIVNTSNVVSVIPHYPPTYLSAFVPEFTQPVLSKDGDALLPPGVDDEPIRESFKDIAIPEGGSTFLFYGGPNDRRGRKGKRGARYMARSHLIYDEKNRVHKHIVRFAKKEITKHALNVSSLSDEADRTALVESKLEQAAKKYMQAQGAEWASHNLGTLKHACNLVMDGFDLRLSIWSNASEGQHQETIIARLLDDQVFPPRFVMGLGADGKWYFLENPVILNIMLDTIRELKLDWYLEDLDSLACAAAVAARCALEKVRDRTSSDAEFLGAAFKTLYTRLMNYIKETIKKCPILRKRWEDYKKHRGRNASIGSTSMKMQFKHGLRVKAGSYYRYICATTLEQGAPAAGQIRSRVPGVLAQEQESWLIAAGRSRSSIDRAASESSRHRVAPASHGDLIQVVPDDIPWEPVTYAEAKKSIFHLSQNKASRPQTRWEAVLDSSSTVDAALSFAHDIKAARNHSFVTSSLSFDIKGYFDNVNHAQLLHIPQDKHIPLLLVK
ncbi:hypothetical protein F4604DRAFT_1689231 [Suillus subluteus]|nr:hypothetical protein F4604DRAFT_1689231 [Suillus subluteus]